MNLLCLCTDGVYGLRGKATELTNNKRRKVLYVFFLIGKELCLVFRDLYISFGLEFSLQDRKKHVNKVGNTYHRHLPIHEMIKIFFYFKIVLIALVPTHASSLQVANSSAIDLPAKTHFYMFVVTFQENNLFTMLNIFLIFHFCL